MIPFEEKHDKFAASGFICTNEEPEAFAQILQGRSFKRVAAIASAGEVIFANLLPRTTEKLVAIDHSYRSVTMTYLKALMLQHLGPRKTRAMFTHWDYNTFRAACNDHAKLLPEALKLAYDGKSPVKGEYGSTQAPLFPAGMSYDFANLRREWGLISLKALQESAAKLELLTLVHGDITDIVDKGPFNLVYFSNAFEHTNRDKKSPRPSDLEPLLAQRGHVLLTKNGRSSRDVTMFYVPADPARWRKLGEYVGCRTQWVHQLWSVQKAKAKKETNAAPAPVAAVDQLQVGG